MRRLRLLWAVTLKELRATMRDRQQVVGMVMILVALLLMADALDNLLKAAFRENVVQAAPANPTPTAMMAQAYVAEVKHTVVRWAILGYLGLIAFFASVFAVPVALASFAGEKEEGTIEVLLAAPQSDLGLYVLKCLSILLPAAALGYVFQLLGMAYMWSRHADRVQALSGDVGWALLLSLPFPVLLASLQTGLGAALSVRAQTVKGAGQMFGAVFAGFGVGGVLLVSTLLSQPADHPLRRWFAGWADLSFATQYGTITGLLLFGTTLLVGVGAALFRREALIR